MAVLGEATEEGTAGRRMLTAAHPAARMAAVRTRVAAAWAARMATHTAAHLAAEVLQEVGHPAMAGLPWVDLADRCGSSMVAARRVRIR